MLRPFGNRNGLLSSMPTHSSSGVRRPFSRLHYYSLQSKEAKKSLLGASIRIEELVFLRRMRRPAGN